MQQEAGPGAILGAVARNLRPHGRPAWTRRSHSVRTGRSRQGHDRRRATSMSTVGRSDATAAGGAGRPSRRRRGPSFTAAATDPAVLITVLTLLVHGCPPQAIVAAFGVDERTVATWQAAAGTHGRRVQDHLVEAGRVELGHVQADELRGKLVGGVVWLATALAVPSRLWRGGAISVRRDEALLRAVCGRVRAAAAGRRVLISSRRVPRLPARDLARLPGTGADGETRSATIGLARRVAGRAGRQAAGAGAGGGDRAAGRARQRGGDPGDDAGDGHRQPTSTRHSSSACMRRCGRGWCRWCGGDGRLAEPCHSWRVRSGCWAPPTTSVGRMKHCGSQHHRGVGGSGGSARRRWRRG